MAEQFVQERRDHVARDVVPWRPYARYTECGRLAVEVASVITPDDLHERIRVHGQQRTAFTVCMTCWTTARHTSRWRTNPAAVLVRELTRVRGYSGHDAAPTDPEAVRANNELRAIAALVEAHRADFDGYLDGVEGAVDLTRRRRQRRGHDVGRR